MWEAGRRVLSEKFFGELKLDGNGVLEDWKVNVEGYVTFFLWGDIGIEEERVVGLEGVGKV